MVADCKTLLYLIDRIPRESEWSALALGRDQLPINVHTILLGGHVRTGLEDNVYYRHGELAESTAQLVERVADIAGMVGRDVADPTEAKKILGIHE